MKKSHQPLAGRSTSGGRAFARDARPTKADDGSDTAWRYALASIWVLLVVLAVRYLADADLGYHLRGGRWILENFRFPAKDVYTYTRSAADYVDLHWIYQILVYSTYRAGGYTALSLLNIVLIAGVFALMTLRLSATGAPLWTRTLLLLAAVLACEVRFHVRPEILTWIFLVLMLLVLEEHWRGRRSLLFLLPVVQLVWTNSEGLFGLGLGVMGAYLLADLVHHPSRDRALWGWCALAIALCLVNPYGFKGVLLPFTYLATLDASNPFKQSIAEFRSPWTMSGRFTSPGLAILVYQLYSFVLLALAALTIRKRQLHQLVILVAFFYLSATALRNVSLFVLATLPIAAASWSDVSWSWLRNSLSSVLSRPAAAWVTVGIALVLSARTVTSAQYISQGRIERFGLGLDGETQPAGAADFLVKNHLDGRILNQMNTGGWLDWTRPGQVFLDGRTEVMGEDLFVESLSSLQPGGLARLIAAYHPDILFFTPATARQWVLDLNAMPEWRLAFLDEGAVVFLRDGYATAVPAVTPAAILSVHGLTVDAGGRAAAILREPPPPNWLSTAASVYRPAVHPNGLQAMALLFQYRNEPQASEALFVECLERSRRQYYDFYFNVGLMYYGSGQGDKARLAMERVLVDDPDNGAARQILERIASR